jgi:arabinan endo-1,5-alpha-L-arabinosidase
MIGQGDSFRFDGRRWTIGTGLLAVLLLIGIGGCDGGGGVTTAPPEEEPDPVMVPQTMNLSGALQDVHDPAIIAAHGQYYLYSTGGGSQWRSSADLSALEYGGDILGGVPPWAEDITEGDLWAPDAAYFNDRYHLYYSASTFGSSRSAIGLATTPTLSPDSANYGWEDQEQVIESVEADPYNAIDPNIITDQEDRIWMAFGSYNDEGIHLRRINSETGMPSSQDETFYNIADRPDTDPNAIEAPYIIQHDGYYYLFVSWGSCCPGPDGSSDYNIRVGRSESVTGPYVDQSGTAMTDGGGTLVLESFGKWQGTGHNSVLQADGETMLVYHAYNTNQNNTPYLRISPIEWEDGWPMVPMTEQ